jgi:hypothetical protein
LVDRDHPIPAQGPTDLKREITPTALTTLLHRVEHAKAAGAVNVAVDVNLLLDLLTGSREALTHLGWRATTSL